MWPLHEDDEAAPAVFHVKTIHIQVCVWWRSLLIALWFDKPYGPVTITWGRWGRTCGVSCKTIHIQVCAWWWSLLSALLFDKRNRPVVVYKYPQLFRLHMLFTSSHHPSHPCPHSTISTALSSFKVTLGHTFSSFTHPSFTPYLSHHGLQWAIVTRPVAHLTFRTYWAYTSSPCFTWNPFFNSVSHVHFWKPSSLLLSSHYTGISLTRLSSHSLDTHSIQSFGNAR